MSKVLDFGSSEFPEYIKECKGFPHKLYLMGELPRNLERCGLGVVGSRRVSSYGIRVLRELFYFLKETDVVVISGFTAGVDSLAHRMALDSGCKTIAVMPCGCDVVHPSENRNLYKRIIDGGGAVISEFENGFQPRRWTYPKRNRIIAALSKFLLVVEASLKSGSMITAGYGFKYGRKVFCVPGDIYMERSKGTNVLIARGARIYVSPEYFLKEIGLESAGKVLNNGSSGGEVNFKSTERAILSILAQGEKNYDNLLAILGVQSFDINLVLSNMLIRGEIGEKEGIYYVL